MSGQFVGNGLVTSMQSALDEKEKDYRDATNVVCSRGFSASIPT